MILLHIVPVEYWEKAQAKAEYRSGTFEYDGFIHCSRPDQALRVAQARFAGRRDLLLLCIDPQKVHAPVWYENLEGGASLFPHIYGPLNLDAVLGAPAFLPGADGIFQLPPEVETLQTQMQPALPQRAASLLEQFPGGIVADVATGGGGFLGLLAETLPEIHLLAGIDTNPAPARNPNGPFAQGKAAFLQMDAQRLGLADGCLDTGAIANSLHHLEEPLSALRELRRAIQAGGRCILQEMYRDGQNLAQQTHVLLHHWWAAVDTGRNICHHITYTRAEIINLIEQTGWRRVMFIDLADLSGDPRDPQLLEELEAIITRYQGFAANQPQAAALHAEGEQLRARVRQVGFQNASALLIVAEK
ncbi:MAG TPA: DUF952 domain-containing protein [Anaerolineaceae bacterium]|nr:DUF952 domain-containing protein [Anaerolineaceae bacterium]